MTRPFFHYSGSSKLENITVIQSSGVPRGENLAHGSLRMVVLRLCLVKQQGQHRKEKNPALIFLVTLYHPRANRDFMPLGKGM